MPASSPGRFAAALARLAGSDPRRRLVVFDFDGTLAPIVPRPEDAHLDPALQPRLEALRGAVGWLAVVSGRPRSLLVDEVPGVLAMGSYGLELPPELSETGLAAGFPAADAHRRLDAARAALEAALPAGARLELKPWGLAVHFRGATRGFDEASAAGLVGSIAADHGLAVQPGRLVYELKPREAPDKGWAVRLLVDRLRPSAVVFVGDDLGDRPGWVAVGRLDLPSLAVAIASPELPAEALAEGDLVLESRDDLAPFLDELVAAT